MQTKNFRAAVLTLLACGCVGLASCSDDDENPGTGTPGGTGGTAAGAGGSSGSAGGGATAGTAGSAGTGVAGAPTMTCGTQTCTGLPGIPIVAPMGIPACCVGPAMDKCGIDATLLMLGCVEKNQPGNPDNTCFATDGGNAGAGGSGAGASSDAATPDASGDDASTGDASGGTSGASGAGGRGGGMGNLPGCCKPSGMCGILVNIPGLELGCVEIPPIDGGPAPQACTPRGS